MENNSLTNKINEFKNFFQKHKIYFGLSFLCNIAVLIHDTYFSCGQNLFLAPLIKYCIISLGGLYMGSVFFKLILFLSNHHNISKGLFYLMLCFGTISSLYYIYKFCIADEVGRSLLISMWKMTNISYIVQYISLILFLIVLHIKNLNTWTKLIVSYLLIGLVVHLSYFLLFFGASTLKSTCCCKDATEKVNSAKCIPEKVSSAKSTSKK